LFALFLISGFKDMKKLFTHLNAGKSGMLSSLFSGFLLLTLLCVACSSPAGSTSSTLSSISTSSSTNSSYGVLAGEGKVLFTAKCSLCHGDKGQGGTGSVIIGSGEALAKYSTAQGLLDKIRTTMPKNSPGSLSNQENLKVLAYLLTQNNFVTSSEILDETKLSSIPVK
jgi:hypothetical protein